MEFKSREKRWLAAHVGCKLKFTCNSVECEEVLDFDRSLGIYCFGFFGASVNAEVCLIADFVR